MPARSPPFKPSFSNAIGRESESCILSTSTKYLPIPNSWLPLCRRPQADILRVFPELLWICLLVWVQGHIIFLLPRRSDSVGLRPSRSYTIPQVNVPESCSARKMTSVHLMQMMELHANIVRWWCKDIFTYIFTLDCFREHKLTIFAATSVFADDDGAHVMFLWKGRFQFQGRKTDFMEEPIKIQNPNPQS